MAQSQGGVGVQSHRWFQDLFGGTVCLVLIYPTAPVNYIGRLSGPQLSLAGGLPREEQGLLPSCSISTCRILKLTQDCVEKCFPFQYANKDKIVSMDVHSGSFLQLNLLMSCSVMRAISSQSICVLDKV